MLAGLKVLLGGKEYVMPVLTYGLTKQAIREGGRLLKLAQSSKDVDPEAVIGAADLMVQTVHKALLRNYPELKLEEVEDGLSLPEIKPSFERLVLMSQGFLKPEVDENGQPIPVPAPPVTDEEVVAPAG